jgi:very-short-patch-repair endonuclease
MEQELAIKLQASGIRYRSQVEIPVTTADFYFSLESRPLLVFVDGRPHLGTAQMVKDEELRTLLRKRGYRILELSHDGYSDRKRDQLYQQILDNLQQEYCLAPLSHSVSSNRKSLAR